MQSIACNRQFGIMNPATQTHCNPRFSEECVHHSWQSMKPASKGFVPAAAAFAIWGLFPLYFHLLREVSAIQVIAHRVVWSCVCVLAWIVMQREMPTLRAPLADRGVVWRLALTATLISINWLAYVWGVLNGRVGEIFNILMWVFLGGGCLVVVVVKPLPVFSPRRGELCWGGGPLLGGGL